MGDEHIDAVVLDLYAWDALDGDEYAAVAAHFQSCASCRTRLAEAQRVATLLALSPTQHTPSPDLRARVLQRAGVTPPQRPWWARLTDRLRVPPAVPRLATALALIAVVALGARTVQLQRQLNAEISARQDVQQHLIVLQSQLAERDQVIALLDAPNARIVPLATQDQTAVGSLLVAPDHQTAYLNAANLPALPADQTYQLWVIDEQPQSVGTFRTDAQGRAALSLAAPEPLGQYANFGISIEPAGGSSTPTNVIVLTNL